MIKISARKPRLDNAGKYFVALLFLFSCSRETLRLPDGIDWESGNTDPWGAAVPWYGAQLEVEVVVVTHCQSQSNNNNNNNTH